MADEILDKLRKDYEDLFGKKAFNGWKADQLQAKIDAKLNGGDDDDEETAGEPVAEARASVATSSDPYPSQADLDAMRAGTYVNRELKSR